MKKPTLLLCAVALVLFAACSAPVNATTAPAATSVTQPLAANSPTSAPAPLAATVTPTLAASAKRPNILFILTDDLDAASIAYMPKLQALLADQGTSFANFFVNVSLCCPSRSSILRGQYAQNTEIFGNSPPDGGFAKFHELGREDSTIATWLQAAGYRTMLAGKYLNGYPQGVEPTYIPPGWSEWYSPAKGNPYSEYNYTLNENGKLVAYKSQPEDYGTDVYARKTIDFIQRASKDSQPFFVYLATYAPHGPATPAPRHANLFPDAQAPRTPAFNEPDVSDKPQYIRDRPRLTPRALASLDQAYRKRLQSLQAVDEMIANLIDTLKTTGELDNTYIFFASDNGFHMGQHRLLQGKTAPYEEDIRVPLIVRGPGVPAGQTREHLTGNIDLAPTFAELAGARIPDFVDGRSLVPLLSDNPPSPGNWRQAYLLQHGAPTEESSLDTEYAGLLEPPDSTDDEATAKRTPRGIPAFQGLRTQDYLYVEYVTGERELYDLRQDPNELNNLSASADPALLAQLAARLKQLARCSAANCRAAEDAPFTGLQAFALFRF
jgi:arylsulfatase A-like enzyme